MALVEAFMVVGIIGFLLYKWVTRKYNVWEERGVPYDKPVPLLGNLPLNVLLGKKSFLSHFLDSYKQFENEKVFGQYGFLDPSLVIRDLELIKKVGIRDFDHFQNHQRNDNMTDENHIFSKTLISLRDRKWKEMRNVLTPSFTGNKMRLMYELVNECCEEGVNYVESQVKASGKNELEMEMKDYFTRYTNDVIASTAFGLKINSFKDRENDFYSIGTTLTQFSGLALVKILLFSIIPKIMKALKADIFNVSKTNYFKKLVADAIKYREEHKIIRPDMIQLLLEAKRQHEKEKETSTETGDHAEFTDEDLLAQCFIFFLAGFETVSVCLCFTLYELAMNQDVQEKLYEEVLETERELEGKPLNYDALMKMKYMDMVLSESLRKWPPVGFTDRECSSDYTLTDDDGNVVVEIKKKDLILIPIVAIHYDPKYYDDPDRFMPERFSEEQKRDRNQMTYMPFGVGPRSCIGNRLALMETKAIVYHFLMKFKILPTEKTPKNMMEALKGFQMIPPEKFWVKFVPRESA